MKIDEENDASERGGVHFIAAEADGSRYAT
jgi:hypothetical protein